MVGSSGRKEVTALELKIMEKTLAIAHLKSQVTTKLTKPHYYYTCGGFGTVPVCIPIYRSVFEERINIKKHQEEKVIIEKRLNKLRAGYLL